MWGKCLNPQSAPMKIEKLERVGERLGDPMRPSNRIGQEDATRSAWVSAIQQKPKQRQTRDNVAVGGVQRSFLNRNTFRFRFVVCPRC